MKGTRILPLAALLVTLLVPSGCSEHTAEELETETVVPVTTEPAATGNIRATLTVTGTVTAAPGAEQIVIAPQPARIAEIQKAEGDRVNAGDVLVRFEIPALVSDVATRRADVARAQARLENARAAQKRAHDLFDRGVAARKEMEDADRELAEALAGVPETQATLTAAETAARQAIVRARFNGVVARRLHNAGDNVEAGSADPILRIVDPRRLEVTAAIPIPDVPRIAIGAAARMPNPTGAADLALRVVSLPAAVDPGTAAVPVRLAFTTPTASAVGVPVQVSIDAEEHRNVVLVPAGAVLHEAEQTAVFVANGDKAERRVVTLGLVDAMHAEIRSGIKAGESVIVKGQNGLPDGATIAVAGADAGKAGSEQ